MNLVNYVVVRAPAKVNLSLDITGRRGDGYHLLDMVMLAVNLYDELRISHVGSVVDVICSDPAVPAGSANIAHRAALRFFEETGLPIAGVRVEIKKRIPMEAGLAGGSADAAAVLTGLNRLFAAGLRLGQLCKIGLQLGADVPFALTGGAAFVQGVGERITPLPLPEEAVLLVVKPPVSMSTGLAYKLYDEHTGTLLRPDTSAILEAVRCGELGAIGQNMRNVFELVLHLPEVEAIKSSLLRSGALGSVMTGSGTAVVGLFAEETEAKSALHALREYAPQVWVLRPEAMGARVVEDYCTGNEP